MEEEYPPPCWELLNCELARDWDWEWDWEGGLWTELVWEWRDMWEEFIVFMVLDLAPRWEDWLEEGPRPIPLPTDDCRSREDLRVMEWLKMSPWGRWGGGWGGKRGVER